MDHEKFLHIIDTNERRRAGIAKLVYGLGLHAEIYGSITEFTQVGPVLGFVLLHDEPRDHTMAEFFGGSKERDTWLPTIVYASLPQPRQIVEAINEGVLDYLAFPFQAAALLEALRRLNGPAGQRRDVFVRRAAARVRINRLSPREGEVLSHMINGRTNRLIALELGISPRTVEIHRTHLLSKLGAQSSADAVRIGFEAAEFGPLVQS